MAMVKRNALAALKESERKVKALVSAAQNDPASTCGVFNTHPGSACEDFTQAQKDAIRRYVETWIEMPLSAAIRSIEGDRNWKTESALNDIERHGARFAVQVRKPIEQELTEQGLTPASLRQSHILRDLLAGGWTVDEIGNAEWNDQTGEWVEPGTCRDCGRACGSLTPPNACCNR